MKICFKQTCIIVTILQLQHVIVRFFPDGLLGTSLRHETLSHRCPHIVRE